MARKRRKPDPPPEEPGEGEAPEEAMGTTQTATAEELIAGAAVTPATLPEAPDVAEGPVDIPEDHCVRFSATVKGPGVDTNTKGEDSFSMALQATPSGCTHHASLYALHADVARVANQVVTVILIPRAPAPSMKDSGYSDQLPLPLDEGPDPNILYITPDRVDEFGNAISAMHIAEERFVKALVQIGEQQYAVVEAASADPITFTCWQAVPLADWGDREYHEYPGDNGDDYDCLKITLRDSGGAPFVLTGPPMRVIAKAPDETEERPQDEGEEQPD